MTLPDPGHVAYIRWGISDCVVFYTFHLRDGSVVEAEAWQDGIDDEAASLECPYRQAGVPFVRDPFLGGCPL